VDATPIVHFKTIERIVLPALSFTRLVFLARLECPTVFVPTVITRQSALSGVRTNRKRLHRFDDAALVAFSRGIIVGRSWSSSFDVGFPVFLVVIIPTIIALIAMLLSVSPQLEGIQGFRFITLHTHFRLHS
jgi:uncharacterized membrane-anchored protein